MPCENCAKKSGVYSYDCFSCVIRNALTMPKRNRLGFMTEAAIKGKHDLEAIKAEVSKQFLEKKK